MDNNIHNMDNNIRNQITILEKRLNELRQSGVTDSFDLELKIIDEMTDFYDTYPSIVKRLCRSANQDNEFLFKMIETLEKVNKGEKSLATVEMQLGEELANKYLYPVIQKK